MSWAQWIARVLAIAEQRGLRASVSFPGPGLATFTWNGAYRQGTAGAGVSMYQITTPESFTLLWQDGPPIQAAEPRPGRQLDSRNIRATRYVPVMPARAVSWALGRIID